MNARILDRLVTTIALVVVSAGAAPAARVHPQPNIILVMSDDQGWGQTGYYNHPVLKTPHLDAMAANGLRFERFYAGGPVCSPTRASVLTGRTHDRTGVYSHGHPLRLQERTLAVAMKTAGYATGHFGKWHLNGLRGPGVPVLSTDTHHPGKFGFDEWLTVSNFFDMNPLMSHMGRFQEFRGDSSEVVVAEALKFISRMRLEGRPSFTVIWYGSPHSPWIASEEDQRAFAGLDSRGRQHHGELAAMDRSIGTLRSGLRKLGIADDTLIWFNSDNGGLKGIGADSVGGLKGRKGTLWEGGLRVPAMVEWPAGIKPRITEYPAAVMDIFPTLVDLLGLPDESMLDVHDGISLRPLFEKDLPRRATPLPFQSGDTTVLIDNDDKIMLDRKRKTYELYNLRDDPAESTNIAGRDPETTARLITLVDALAASIARSDTGADYPEGTVVDQEPERRFWAESPAYEPYLDELLARPEYRGQIRNAKRKEPLETP